MLMMITVIIIINVIIIAFFFFLFLLMLLFPGVIPIVIDGVKIIISGPVTIILYVSSISSLRLSLS